MNNFERNCIFGLFRIMVRLLLIAAACVVAVHAKEQKGNIFGGLSIYLTYSVNPINKE